MDPSVRCLEKEIADVLGLSHDWVSQYDDEPIQPNKEHKVPQRGTFPDSNVWSLENGAWRLHLNTFNKYREAGLAVLKSGYKKGKWHSTHCKEALEEWAISQQTFSAMVQLGELTDEEFTVKNQSPSQDFINLKITTNLFYSLVFFKESIHYRCFDLRQSTDNVRDSILP